MSSVDVVIPCYNYAHYLHFCVESVLTQRDVDLRVLIIDDASPDNTPEVASSIAAADSRVTYVRNEINLGLIGTANKGVLDWAAADYVVLLSADDALTPGSLARSANLMDAHPEVSLTYGMALMMHDDGPALDIQDTHNPQYAVMPGKDFLRRMCECGNPAPTPCAVMRTSVQRRIGGYDSRFKHTSDADMWMRAAAAGSIGVVNAVQGLYRWHSMNMSAPYYRRPIGDRAEMLATCREFLSKHGENLPEFSGWLARMERRFGDDALLIARALYESRSDGDWRETLAFAKYCRPDYWKSPVWWNFIIKRICGRHAVALIRSIKKAIRPPSDLALERESIGWPDHGMEFGWWP